MQVATAGTGVQVSDGSSNILPVGDHGAVLHAWTVQARLVWRALGAGSTRAGTCIRRSCPPGSS